MPHKDPAVRAAYLRAWRERNRERAASWELEHRQERLARKRELHHIHRDRERVAFREYRAQMMGEFWAVYGHKLARGEFGRLYAAQGGACALCGAIRPARGPGCLQVDHDHETGERRGLLCKGCNGALGSVERDARTRRDSGWLSRAVAYAADPPLRRLRRAADGPGDTGRAKEEPE
jgi:hypothetical protein